MNSRTRTPFGTPTCRACRSVEAGPDAGRPAGNNPPDKRHVSLPADKLKPGRIIIVGDVHGCCTELDALLKECQYQEEVDNLILAGDVVNKGPESVQALQRAQQLGALVVRGNHEDACLALKRRFSIVSSLASNYKWLKDLTPDDVEYMQNLPFTIELPSHNTLIVHAGLVPNAPLAQQTMKDMLFLEEVDRDVSDKNKYKCYYKERPGNKEASWARYWQGPHHVFFGHASKKEVQHYKYATGLDTSCVHEGKLTACILPPAKELEAHAPYQKYLECCKSGSGKRPPTFEELNAVLKEVRRREPQVSQLLSTPSIGHCTEKFSRDDEQPRGITTARSGPAPDIQRQSIGVPNRAANLTS